MENEEQPKNENKPKSAIDEAKETLAQIKQEKEELKALVEKAELMKSEEMISGQAQATKVTEPKEETPEEYKNKVLKGEL